MKKWAYMRLLRRKLHRYFDLRAILRRLLNLSGTAHHIAISFAIGVWISFVPVIGVQTIISLALAWLFKLNTVAVVSGSLFTNPLTFIPLYGLAFKVGEWFAPQSVDIVLFAGNTPSDVAHLFALLKPHLVEFLIGCAIVGMFFGVLSYFLLRIFIKSYRSEKHGKNSKS